METTKKRHRSDPRWMARHVGDPYVRAAQAQGYRSRAAFKLIEIDDRDRLLRPGQCVIDLGATPGSWSQVAVRRVASASASAPGRVLALDLLPMEPLAGVEFMLGDFREHEVMQDLASRLAGRKADLVLSDMAPNLSGIAAADAARVAHLGELALEFAVSYLADDGSLLVKTFQGSGYSQFVSALKRAFSSVAVRKPPASRAESAETYLLARRPRRLP